MMDQPSKFASLGLLVEYVGESQNDRSVIQRVLHGQVQLVYITPENIMDNPMYRNMLLSNIYRKKLVGLIVDEAQCVKLWGDQFRISFSKLGNLQSIVPSTVNIKALTATATHETYLSVLSKLAMTDPVLVSIPPERGNITYYVHPPTSVDELSGMLNPS